MLVVGGEEEDLFSLFFSILLPLRMVRMDQTGGAQGMLPVRSTTIIIAARVYLRQRRRERRSLALNDRRQRRWWRLRPEANDHAVGGWKMT